MLQSPFDSELGQDRGVWILLFYRVTVAPMPDQSKGFSSTEAREQSIHEYIIASKEA